MKTIQFVVIITLTMFFSGCGDSEKIKLIEEEIRHLKAVNIDNNEKLNAIIEENTKLKIALAKKGEKLDGISLSGKSIQSVGEIFSDEASAVSVEILQILTNEQIIKYSKATEYKLDELKKRNKDLLYFEVKITNNKFEGELNVSFSGFKLESTDGETFVSGLAGAGISEDYIDTDIDKGKSARGGILFKIHTDTVPKTLVFRSGLENRRGEPLTARSTDLREFLGSN